MEGNKGSTVLDCMGKHKTEITNGVCNMNIATQQESTNFLCKEPDDKYLKFASQQAKWRISCCCKKVTKREKKFQFFTNNPLQKIMSTILSL